MSEYENNEDVIGRLIPMLCAALFVCCMVCHGELAKRKPHPRYLTQYFLMVSVGGAVGGLFVAMFAPRFFPSYWEMPIAVGGCALLMALALWNDEETGAPRPWAYRVAMLLVVGAFAFYLGRLERYTSLDYNLSARNFYGVLRVRDDPEGYGYIPVRTLIHGTINHGTQIIGPEGGRTPTSYFGYTSGINRAVRAKGEKGPIRIGILGLGAGVTATLAREGDTLHYYEINPLIFEIAQNNFRFWEECPADKQIFFGDGRLVLEGMADENLDFLAMDAFTSDAVPMHLLTREAFQIYSRHLKPDGVLAVNISNRYLDLQPPLAAAAAEAGFSGIMVYDEGNAEPFYVGNTWVLMNRDASFFTHGNFADGEVYDLTSEPGAEPWTDDYSNILNILHCRKTNSCFFTP